MLSKVITAFLLTVLLQTHGARAEYCAQVYAETKDYTAYYLKDLKPLQQSYRKDLYGRNQLDPQFLNNFGRETKDYYAISEVIQNYPIPQARESVQGVLDRLKYVRNHLQDFKLSGADKQTFSMKIYDELIADGEQLIAKKKWPFFKTMDFIDAGLMYGTGLRSTKEVEGGVIDPSYIKIREKSVEIHGQADPALVYMFWNDRPGRAFEYLPHPALIVPFFVRDRLFEFREFNWAMTKGAFLISVGPHQDLVAHEIESSYYAFYHDLTGHFRGTAVNRTQVFLENLYKKKGLQEIDQVNRNKNEAIRLIKAYIELREDFLSKLLAAGEARLSKEDQNAFHEAIFDYIHENGGGVLEPRRMRDRFQKDSDKTPANLLIIATLDKYLATHDVGTFQ